MRRLMQRVARAMGVTTLVCQVACSADDATKPSVATDGAAAAGGASGAAGAGANGGGGGVGAGAGGGAAGDAPPPNCVGETHEAMEVPVAMYVMLDRSGSMLIETGAGPSKWDATVTALTSFVQAEGSEGLWVGLQYFPLRAEDVPETCRADADCGALGGACMNKACLPSVVGSQIPFSFCLSNLDCPITSGGCADFGLCAQDDTLACFDIGDAQGCDTFGACEAWDSECQFYASCDVTDYAAPAVAISALPGNAQALVDSLVAAAPRGLTPTSVALAGALEQAAEFAATHPDHAVLAVLATDGLPTDCAPTDIGSIVAIARGAASGTPSLRTHVIGVFAADETAALGNLDALAVAGGSERALIVDPTADVSAQFLEALDVIRAGSVGCELRLPPAPVDVSLDYNRINVELTEAASMRQLVFVDQLGGCEDVELGWYYDRAPGQDVDPGRIVMCPETCTAVQMSKGASVRIRLGCLTRRPD